MLLPWGNGPGDSSWAGLSLEAQTPGSGGTGVGDDEAAPGRPVICATAPLLQARPPSGPPAACVWAGSCSSDKGKNACLIWLIVGRVPRVHTDVLLEESSHY